jgi:hypothetical protein
MNRREEFLTKALEVHREYEGVTTRMRKMMEENRSFGPEWDVEDAKQRVVCWASMTTA